MVINERNSLINSFVKGMNADLAFDLIENQQYIFGRNIRITKNLQIGEASDDDYTSLHEGIITPVPKGVDIEIDSSYNLKNHKILAIDTIDNLGTIVTKSPDKTMCVFKFHLYERTGSNEDYCPSLDLMFESSETIGDIDRVSTVLYRELYNVVKLYIADGIHPMITIRVDDDTAPQIGDKVSFDDVISNRILPQERVYIQNKISGRLKTGQVLYTYRYYNKYGITTQLAPLTNKIQVIDSNRNKEIGNAQDTETSVGFSLKINSDEYKDKFERLQIYRLHYIKKDQDAEISLIYDGEVVSQFNDIGIEPLQSLTIEEFYALSGVIVVPKVIEHNQQYMFASNITDDTIMKDLNINLPDANNKYLNQILTSVVIANKNNDDEFVTPSMSGEKFNSTYIIDDTYKVSDYFKDRDINPDLATSTYNNIFTSSLLRSLRRGETYKYGIVYYDSHGRRSDVHNLGTIDVSPIQRNMSFVVQDGKCIAKPIGVKIRLPQPVDENGDIYKDIIGCQIVRRSSSSIYQNTLMQVALARPIRQPLYNTVIEFDSNKKITTPVSYSPYYPTGFLWSDYTRIGPGYYIDAQKYYDFEDGPSDYDVNAVGTDTYDLLPSGVDNFTATSKDNKHLFLIFSSEIDFRRNDALSTLTLSEVSILPLYAAAIYSPNINNSVKYTNDYVTGKLGIVLPFEDCTDFSFIDHPRRIFKSNFIDIYNGTRCSENNPVSIYRRSITQKANDKTQQSLIFNLYTTSKLDIASSSVKNVKDVKMAKWYEGFSNIDIGGDDARILTGISQYRSYTTTIDEYMYNNWVSFGLYDLRISAGTGTQVNVSENAYAAQFLDGDSPQYRQYPFQEPDDDVFAKTLTGSGYIGPGGSCLLITTGGEFDNNIVTDFGTATAICNITHKASSENEPDEFVQYFGFGNYFKLKFNNEENKYVVDQPSGTKEYMYVFDGDIYITPHELTTMYKAYDFNSKDTLQSILVINYVPLESKVNTCFDYGMNYVNTTSANLLNESGTIDGVVVQDRPPHQYNIVYSDNDSSTDIFTLTITDKKETNRFSQRTYFSEPKTNGEFIDNFSRFKSASFIDADSRYGQITELFSDSNTLFFWLDGAFGKFSVNERSLINDQEGNTIMLGQAGILSRYDYISTTYGMRLYDFCEVSAEHGIYWVDINNRAIVAATTKTTGLHSTFSAVNYGEALNVQNIINANISTDRPLMDYDVQNNELLCKCFEDGSQLVFNLKYNMATSLYDRDYVDIAYIKNHIYGLSNINDNPKFIKYNYLDYSDNASEYLTPLQLDFIVNPVASITKVYDSLTLIPIKRRKAAENKNIVNRIFYNTTMSFETDILPETSQSIQPYTDREGNIIYNVPRFDSSEIGNRIRGKWMRVNITRNNPDRYFTISHIITKFRQSYS